MAGWEGLYGERGLLLVRRELSSEIGSAGVFFFCTSCFPQRCLSPQRHDSPMMLNFATHGGGSKAVVSGYQGFGAVGGPLGRKEAVGMRDAPTIVYHILFLSPSSWEVSIGRCFWLPG